jgi:hypothetical protein
MKIKFALDGQVEFLSSHLFEVHVMKMVALISVFLFFFSNLWGSWVDYDRQEHLTKFGYIEEVKKVKESF